MGIFFSKVWARLASGKEKRLLMVGLDAAGKTTILYRLRLAEAATTVPTIGFNMETVEYRNIKFDIWDVGGQDQIRKLWRHYFKGTDGLIYVVDSADRERINDAKEELEKMLKEVQLQDATLLVLANKQDLKDAMPAAEIMQKLDLPRLGMNRTWFIQSTVAPTGEMATTKDVPSSEHYLLLLVRHLLLEAMHLFRVANIVTTCFHFFSLLPYLIK